MANRHEELRTELRNLYDLSAKLTSDAAIREIERRINILEQEAASIAD